MNKKVRTYLLGTLIALFSLSLSSVYAVQDMGYIDLHFCDGSRHLQATTVSWAANYDICMNFQNNGNEAMTFHVDIVEGEVAYGATTTQACDTAPSGYFGKNTVLSGASVLTIGVGQTIQKDAIFTPPPGFAGIAHGCITFSLVQTATGNGMFSIISRKANLVDITVPGIVKSDFHLAPIDSIPGNSGSVFQQYGNMERGNDSFKVLYDPKIRVITAIAGLQNDGYADEEYQVTAKVSSYFGLVHQAFTGPTGAVLYANNGTVNQLAMQIPRYEWPVSISWQVAHRQTVLSWQQAKDRQLIAENFSFIIIPWELIILIALIIIFLLLCLRIYRHRRKKKRERVAAQEPLPPPPVKKTKAVAPAKKEVAVKKTVVTKQRVVKDVEKWEAKNQKETKSKSVQKESSSTSAALAEKRKKAKKMNETI